MNKAIQDSIKRENLLPYVRGGTATKFYITTAIDYPNAPPHVGTAFEKIGADIQARFRRFQGLDVYFLMGNDENTLKVYRAADKLGENPFAYANRMAAEFKAVWKALDISNDDFIQTTEKRHAAGVCKFIQTVYEAGYIYKKPFKSLYCNGCEEFKTAKSLVNGKCPNHPNEEVYEASEDNYFFKLSAFKQWILDLYVPAFDSAHTDIQPESRLNEMKAFVEAELEDISISRVNQNWGILCPFDEAQAIYVWFDALLNYLTGVGFGTDQAKFDKYWPANVHVIGKDITRFHCALWLAMIAAYNEGARKKGEPPIAYPEQVFAHGFIYARKGDDLVKESKSNGNAVKPMDLVEKYGADSYRYYFMGKCPFYGDGEYSVEHFDEVYNSDLANNFGNLVSRVCNMALQYFEGEFINFKEYLLEQSPDWPSGHFWFTQDDLLDWSDNTVKFRYREALAGVWTMLRHANEYIDREKPWELNKTNKQRCGCVLFNLMACLRVAAIQLKPYLPATSKKLYESFMFKTPWDELDWNYLNEVARDNYYELNPKTSLNWAVLDKTTEKTKFPPLFPRTDGGK